MSSPFESPRDPVIIPRRSWAHVAGRGVSALGIALYSVLLAIPGVLLCVPFFLFGVLADEIPTDGLVALGALIAVSLSVGVLGLVCAGVLTVFRRLATVSLVTFAVYVPIAMTLFAIVRATSDEPLYEALIVFAVGLIPPFWCAASVVLLRLIASRERA